MGLRLGGAGKGNPGIPPITIKKCTRSEHMSFLAPKPPSLPPLPTRDDEEVEEARRKQRLAARLRRGRGATILTSGAGLTDPAPVGRKRLLGE